MDPDHSLPRYVRHILFFHNGFRGRKTPLPWVARSSGAMAVIGQPSLLLRRTRVAALHTGVSRRSPSRPPACLRGVPCDRQGTPASCGRGSCPVVWPGQAAQHHRCVPVPQATRWRYPTPRSCCSRGGAGCGRRSEPRPGLSANPVTPCARKRCAHLHKAPCGRTLRMSDISSGASPLHG